MSTESLILSNLVFNEEYGRKVMPFLKSEYFHSKGDKVVFDLISYYVGRYNAFPTKEALYIDLDNLGSMSQTEYDGCKKLIQGLSIDTSTKLDWLIEKSEAFCKDKAVYNGIMESISILEGKNPKIDKGAIPSILQDALAVSFDVSVGHNIFEDAAARYDFYTNPEAKIPFDIDILNKITKGGVSRKTLNCVMAGTGVGKSIVLCHLATNDLLSGKNVLYITCEMAEEKIGERIDANMIDVSIDKIADMGKEAFLKRVEKVKANTPGQLIIKQYPNSTAGVQHFRYLLSELLTKQNFKPDVIYIDYLNICISSKLKMGGGVNSYTYIKAIAEEIRAMAVEYDVPIWTATQVNRDGVKSSDFDIGDTSESMGLAHTLDLFLGIMTTPELEAMGQFLFKILKNRYGSKINFNKFLVGIDYSRMRLYNIEEPDKGLISDNPVMDNSAFGEREENDHKPKSKFRKSDFSKFS